MICSKHFEAECFETSLAQKAEFYSQRRLMKLKADAIPTLHLHVASAVKKKDLKSKPLPFIDEQLSESSIHDDESTSVGKEQ